MSEELAFTLEIDNTGYITIRNADGDDIWGGGFRKEAIDALTIFLNRYAFLAEDEK